MEREPFYIDYTKVCPLLIVTGMFSSENFIKAIQALPDCDRLEEKRPHLVFPMSRSTIIDVIVRARVRKWRQCFHRI